MRVERGLIQNLRKDPSVSIPPPSPEPSQMNYTATSPQPSAAVLPLPRGGRPVGLERQEGKLSLRAQVDAGLIRAFDIGVSLALLLLLLPVIVLAAIAVRFDSPGPSFFRAERVGFKGRRLRMLKFRKMRDDARGLALTAANDERFTRIGRVLAKFKIDEIPQLWNVLRGQMSLVGPRPETSEFVALHSPDYEIILSVRPGVTGLSQIAFAEESHVLDRLSQLGLAEGSHTHEDGQPVNHYVARILPQKVGMDSMYALERTLWLNLRILFWTTAAVIMRRQVAVHRGSGKMNLRRR